MRYVIVAFFCKAVENCVPKYTNVVAVYNV